MKVTLSDILEIFVEAGGDYNHRELPTRKVRKPRADLGKSKTVKNKSLFYYPTIRQRDLLNIHCELSKKLNGNH